MSCSKWLFQYPNEIFIETGSGRGGGISHAIGYGFKKIYSMEINKSYYDICVNKFKDNINIKLYNGDCLDILPKILEEINQSATFLLDAHVMNIDSLSGKKICPILEELTIILNNSKDKEYKHKIIVDDVKYFNGQFAPFGNFSVEDIRKHVEGIDKRYNFKCHRKHMVFI